MNNFIISFIITFIAGISTLIGGFIPFLKIKNKENVILMSLAFASGIMLSISVLDLIPEAFNYLVNDNGLFVTFIFIIISFFTGIILFMILNKFLTEDVDNLYRVGIFSMLAIILHNIPEGIITFILTSSDIRIGLFMGFSIALHNIPEGISIMVPIYYGSGNFKKAFIYTLVAGVAEILGGVIFYLLFGDCINKSLLGCLFALVAGIMIYLSFFELLPESLKYKKNNLTLFMFMFGIIFFLVMSIFIH